MESFSTSGLSDPSKCIKVLLRKPKTQLVTSKLQHIFDYFIFLKYSLSKGFFDCLTLYYLIYCASAVLKVTGVVW